MSTEEKITENLGTVEPPKHKRRLKLDKKHIQGFIAGILLCAIAFTGLYYGTDGRFFAGSVTSELPVVSDTNFENEVIKSDQVVLVVPLRSNWTDSYWDYDINRKNVDAARSMASWRFSVKIKPVILDIDNSSETMQAYNIKEGPRILVFQDGDYVFQGNKDRVFQWIWMNCGTV